MDREDVWDLYFKRLHSLISSARGFAKELVFAETRKELFSRWNETGAGVVRAYADAGVSFIEERLYAYGLDHVERFLLACSRGVSLEDMALLEKALSWFEWEEEKQEIDARIETGLNLLMPGSGIAKALTGEFGAFPDKTIINAYLKSPRKNRLPDYALALALERVVKAGAGNGRV